MLSAPHSTGMEHGQPEYCDGAKARLMSERRDAQNVRKSTGEVVTPPKRRWSGPRGSRCAARYARPSTAWDAVQRLGLDLREMNPFERIDHVAKLTAEP